LRVTATVALGLLLFTVTSASAQDVPQTAPGIRLAPKAFRAAAVRVRPSLVTIESFGGVAPSGAGRGMMRPGEGPTTGVIFSPDGYIITSTFNFARRPPVITVALEDGSRHVARLCGRDNTRKVCLLKIDVPEPLPAAEIAPQSELRVGQWAIAVGMGFGGDDPAVSAGIISALGRIAGRAVQTDAKTSPANYGGPLVDVQGRVIGICVPLHPQSKEVTSGVQWYDSGIGFAVPLDGLETVLSAMKDGKTLEPAFLGVQVKSNEGDESKVVVAKVQPDSPAAEAKVQEGDRIVDVDGDPVRDARHLKLLIARHVAGDTVRLTLARDEKELAIEVKLAKPPPRREPAPKVRAKEMPPKPSPT
jgi:serine protease Do